MPKPKEGMTIDEAIETLERHYILHFDVPLADLNKASELGIEALKRLEDQRLSCRPINLDLLPGETRD